MSAPHGSLWPVARERGENVTDVEYQDFNAYREHQGKSFRVNGTVVVKNAGYIVSVERLRSGINPDDVLLKLVFHADFEGRSEQLVEYIEEWGEGEPPTYKTVTFSVEGADVKPPPQLTVGDVH